MIQDLSPREKFFLAGGAGILLLLLILFGVVLPYRSAVSKLDNRVARLQRDLQEVRSMQTQLNQIQAELQLKERKLADSASTSSFSTIENLVTRLGFRDKLVAMRPQPASEREGMRVETVSARIEGIDLQQLVRLLKSLESADSLLDVTSMQIRTRFDNPSELDTELSIESLKQAR